jgi:hypothetical protein
LEAPTATNGAGTGGVFAAIRAVAQQTSYRRFSRRLAVFTVYELDDEAGIAATRAAILKTNMFPVFLIPRGVETNIVSFWNGMNDRLDGFPSLVIRIDQSGSDFQSAFRNLFLLSASYPHVVVTDITDNQYNHVDRTLLADTADSLNIAGLTNLNFRARFNIPMKHNLVNTHHVAQINIPGFGSSIIEDVPSITPIITGDRSFDGRENQACILITLGAETFNNLASPVFEIKTLPSPGSLHVYDAGQPGSVGDAVITGYYAQKSFCFVPVAWDHSTPASDVYASFVYSATDGCLESNDATVSIFVTPIYEPPRTTLAPLVIKETDQATPASIPQIQIVAFEADKLDSGVQETVTFTWSSFSAKYMSSLHGAEPVDFYSSANLNPTGPIANAESFGPETVNGAFQVTQTVTYNPPSEHFFGTVYAYVTLTDNGDPSLSSTAYPVIVEVTPVNDAPTVSVQADANFDPSGANQWVKEDDTTIIAINAEDIDNFGISVDLRITGVQSGTAANPPTVNGVALTGNWLNGACVSTAQSGRVQCNIAYAPTANYFSCGNGIATTPNPALLSSCGAPALVIEYRVNDNNAAGFGWPDVNGNVADAVSGVQTVEIHVIAVNDPPQAPPNTIITMVEDQGSADVVITVTDIDTQSSEIDMWVYTICPELITLTQQGGAPISNGDEIMDVQKKRFTQDHKFIATTIANLHGTDRDTNWEICRVTTVATDQEPLTSLENGWVSIRVRPTNDAPYDLLNFFEKNEDVNDIYNIMDLTATDVDNDLADLTYVITQLPWYDIAKGEGVVIHPIDPLTGNVNEDVYLTEDMLPYTVEKNDVNDALVWVRNLANWYGTLDESDEVLIYQVTDVDAFLNAGETGYIVNTVPSSVTIVIPPVNDRPITTIQPPSGLEDVVQAVYLFGLNDKFGEQEDRLDVFVKTMDVTFSNSYQGSPTLFYHFDEAWYNAYVVDPTSVSVDDLESLEIDEQIIDEEYRILFVPPQHMNKEASRFTTPLFIAPQLTYEMFETISHATPVELRSTISEPVLITVNPVNDVPVTWGGEWNVESNEAYDAFYGGNAWTFPEGHGDDATSFDNTVCIDDCYYTEDFGLVGHYVSISPREIKFGGRDVEGDDLQVVIRNVDCQSTLSAPRAAMWEYINETARFPVATEDLVGMTLGRLVKRLDGGEGYKLVSMLAFAPARDDWNVESDETHENDVSGTASEFYCQLTYAVIDAEGLASDDAVLGTDPKVITIHVRQQNDQPTDSVLQDPSQSSTLIGYEDHDLFIRFDATDVEDDNFDFAITACVSPRGKFYFPTAAQSNHINADGELDTSQDIATLFDLRNPVVCDVATIANPQMEYIDTNGRGWYILFRPDENEFGMDFASITVSYDDGSVVGQAPQLSSRKIIIQPVNDAPIILTGGSLASEIKNTLVIAAGTPLSLSLSFQDDDDIPTFDQVGFQLRVKSATPQKENANIAEAFSYIVAPNEVSLDDRDLVAPVDADNLGGIVWIGSLAQGNAYASHLSIEFSELGDYVVEVVVVDNGMTGYCTPDVVVDNSVYPEDDIRTRLGTNGQLLGQPGYEASRCNRVSSHEFGVKITVSASVIGGAAAGAGAGLLALLALGAVAFAKLNKPEDLDAWQALDNAQITNAQQSGIHKGAATGGQSAIFQSNN